ncbi:MAG: phosphoglucosamine mutase [Gemmatimonadales bacterium]|nr:MAG: phosphoglucosamine mutase [Gemmatimonadales bacterium]
MSGMPLVLPSSLMVSVSGFRGRVGDPLTPELMAGLAAGFGSFLRAEHSGHTVFLGRDSRTSGTMFEAAAAAGLASVGMDVVRLGIVPTPTLLMAARDAGAAGALGVTASHNPAEWNALKFAGGDGMFLDGPRMHRFQSSLRDGDPVRAAWDELGGIRDDDEAIDRHVAQILELPFLELEALRERAFHVALDCVQGAGGLAVPRLLEALGCTVSAMGMEADGHFPRDPEPTAANLSGLGALVRESGAELGFAVDPDVDRLSLVDETGRPLGEDLTLALCAATVLKRRSGPVVTNLSTSRVVEDVARDAGVEFTLAPVGEINVSRAMQEVGAVIGGEGNGGVILPTLHGTRDALVGMALILQHLIDREASLGEAAAEWPEYRIVKEKAAFPRDRLDEGYAALRRALPATRVDTTDGLRLDWPEEGRWLHVRPSGTEPVVRFIAEARDEQGARELIAAAREALDG